MGLDDPQVLLEIVRQTMKKIMKIEMLQKNLHFQQKYLFYLQLISLLKAEN
jgi:hypothetical protein